MAIDFENFIREQTAEPIVAEPVVRFVATAKGVYKEVVDYEAIKSDISKPINRGDLFSLYEKPVVDPNKKYPTVPTSFRQQIELNRAVRYDAKPLLSFKFNCQAFIEIDQDKLRFLQEREKFKQNGPQSKADQN